MKTKFYILYPLICLRTNIKRLYNIITDNGANCYDYLLSLGYNCEVTFKFFKYYKCEISGLFNWAYSRSINDLIYALEHFEMIGGGGGWINPHE